MRRRLMITAAAISLILAALFAASWVLSYRVTWSWGYYRGLDSTGYYRDYYFHSNSGHIAWTWFWQHAPSTNKRDAFLFHTTAVTDPDRRPWLWARRDSGFALAGFWYETMANPGSLGWHTMAIPYWFLITLSLILPVYAWRKARRSAAGHCKPCGYDLRATPSRCPECGTFTSPVDNAAPSV